VKPRLKRLREFIHGFMQISYGSCAGDPIEWEKGVLRRIRERESSSDPDKSGTLEKPEKPARLATDS
jgi:hypothetical protein